MTTPEAQDGPPVDADPNSDASTPRENKNGQDSRQDAEPDTVSDPNSNEEPQRDNTQSTDSGSRSDRNAAEHEAGNVLPPPPSPSSASDAEGHAHARGDPRTVTQRLHREGRWAEVEPVRDRMMKEAKKAFPDKKARQAWVYGELDRMYPPKPDSVSVSKPDSVSETPDSVSETPDSKADSVSGSIRGLGDLPEDWPDLPANASLSSEVGWVQANRLRVCSETASGASVVDLGRALSPAPSWAALGWLETSIRSYAKFVDVAAKATASTDDEAAVWRHERRAIEEVRGLLAEMTASPGGAGA